MEGLLKSRYAERQPFLDISNNNNDKIIMMMIDDDDSDDDC